MTRYTLDIVIEGLPRMLNSGAGQSRNWRAVHASKVEWKKKVVAYCIGKRPRAPLKKAKLALTRFSAVRPDSDGLVGGFKPVIDGLVDARVLENDRFENIGFPTFLWEMAKRGEGRIRIQVEEIECESK